MTIYSPPPPPPPPPPSPKTNTPRYYTSAGEIRDSELFDALSRYRMDYRRHRMGAARGAKGEITALAMGSGSVTGSKRSSMKVHA